MSVYKIPLKFEAGEYKFYRLNDSDSECLKLNYDEKYELLTYEAPMFENEVRIYTVPQDKMPTQLTAVYDEYGTLERVTLPGASERLLYIWLKDAAKSESVVLEYVRTQADEISEKIIERGQAISRLFFDRFYDGEAVDISVGTATAEEMQAVIDKYDGDTSTVDNSGNYPRENMIMIRFEPLAIMLMCTDGEYRSTIFEKAAAAFEERIKSRVLDKISKTEDFKIISEEYD